jgi:hypothetical protein
MDGDERTQCRQAAASREMSLDLPTRVLANCVTGLRYDGCVAGRRRAPIERSTRSSKHRFDIQWRATVSIRDRENDFCRFAHLGLIRTTPNEYIIPLVS